MTAHFGRHRKTFCVSVRGVGTLLEDWQHTKRRLADTEVWMTAVLDELDLTGLVTSITGLSVVGAARSSLRPVTPRGSPPRALWSSTPGSRRGRSCPGTSAAERN
jgi:hypothetical protein